MYQLLIWTNDKQLEILNYADREPAEEQGEKLYKEPGVMSFEVFDTSTGEVKVYKAK